MTAKNTKNNIKSQKKNLEVIVIISNLPLENKAYLYFARRMSPLIALSNHHFAASGHKTSMLRVNISIN